MYNVYNESSNLKQSFCKSLHNFQIEFGFPWLYAFHHTHVQENSSIVKLLYWRMLCITHIRKGVTMYGITIMTTFVLIAHIIDNVDLLISGDHSLSVHGLWSSLTQQTLELTWSIMCTIVHTVLRVITFIKDPGTKFVTKHKCNETSQWE